MGRKNSRKAGDFDSPDFFLDRELSWLAFNDRVLEEAEDKSTPLLERLKFLGIATSNLDEFFMVRVSGVQEQVLADVRKRNPAGFTPAEHFERIHEAAHVQVERQYECLLKQVLPALAEESIHLRKPGDLNRAQRDFVRKLFDREVFPVLTPLAVDSGHPFPHLRNLSLNLAVRLAPPKGHRTDHPLFAVVQVPAVLDRLVRLPPREHGHHEFLLLEDLIAQEIPLLFPGMKPTEVCAFRVTRDADVEFAEEEADDLLKTIEEELRNRERGSAVRLGVEKKGSEELVSVICEALGLQPLQVYRMKGPINLAEVAGISAHVDRPDLKYPPFVPAVREPLRSDKNVFSAVSREDILLHHPYESFGPVEDFVSQAAADPNVLAIKLTLYRTSGDSPIIRALMEAAEKGKQVAALVELKARFDEERNIGWAKQLEKAGVHVVYGLVGLKTHTKVCLVVRKEPGGIRRYVHLGTGNYNPATARLYTDLGLLTCDPDLCDDASELFNMLTGYSRMSRWRKMIVAPIEMREAFGRLIDGETEKARQGRRGRIRAKMNSLVDTRIIQRLYEASCAGVEIDLLVRGICCLRPGIKGLSGNIRVSSIVGRFLEHSRIFVFGEKDEKKTYLSSADWMPRNLDRRVEALFPIEDPMLQERVVREVFEAGWMDNVKRRVLKPSGIYVRVERDANEDPLEAQTALLALEDELRERKQARPATPEALVSPATEPKQPTAAAPIRPAKPAARSLRAIRGRLLTEADGEVPAPPSPTSGKDNGSRTPATGDGARRKGGSTA